MMTAEETNSELSARDEHATGSSPEKKAFLNEFLSTHVLSCNHSSLIKEFPIRVIYVNASASFKLNF